MHDDIYDDVLGLDMFEQAHWHFVHGADEHVAKLRQGFSGLSHEGSSLSARSGGDATGRANDATQKRDVASRRKQQKI
jgi:hypothetical protein